MLKGAFRSLDGVFPYAYMHGYGCSNDGYPVYHLVPEGGYCQKIPVKLRLRGTNLIAY